MSLMNGKNQIFKTLCIKHGLKTCSFHKNIFNKLVVKNQTFNISNILSTIQTHCYVTGSALYFGRLPKLKIYLHIYNTCKYNWRATSTNVEIHGILKIYRLKVP